MNTIPQEIELILIMTFSKSYIYTYPVNSKFTNDNHFAMANERKTETLQIQSSLDHADLSSLDT